MPKAFHFFILLSSLLLVGAVKALTIAEIKEAIVKKGAKWQAGRNWVWNIPLNQKIKLMGVVPQKQEIFHFDTGSDTFRYGLPDYLNWHNVDGKDYMSPVTNQGKCGSCVAFAAMATLEGQVNITNNWPDLDMNYSEQHIWACGSGRCNRGWYPSSAASFLQSYGVPDEACFPYLSGSMGEDLQCSQSCNNHQERSFKINSYRQIGGWFSNTREVISALQHGPLLGTMTVYEDFVAYTGGVYEHVTGGVLGGHAVTLVGYDNNQKYWIVKNSWSPQWGEKGYFRIKMNDDSGVGRSNIRFYINPFNGQAKIKTPQFREIISKTYNIILESSIENTLKMQLEVKNDELNKVYPAVKQVDGTYLVRLNTTELQDDVYLGQAVAFIEKDNQTQKINSQIKRLFVLNNSPEIKVKLMKPQDGAVLKDRIYFEFKIQTSPIPLEKLVVKLKNSDGRILKVINNNPAEKTLLGWRTNLSSNGDYEVWGVGYMGPHTSESKHIRVTVNN